MADYGLDIAIPFTGDPDPTLPWADDDDALLVPGSLALVDFAHSAGPTIGVPAVSADISNLAWKRLRDIVGGASFTGRIDNGTVGNAGTVLTVTAIQSGTIVPGQMFNAGGIAANTYYIAGQVSGTPGGVGVYTIAFTGGLNVASTAITTVPIDSANGAFYRDGFADNPAIMINERTVKGGLNNIQTQTNGAINSGLAIRGKAALEAWLAANGGHSYYFSMWDRPTRLAATTEPFEALMGLSTSSSFLTLTPGEASTWPPLTSSGKRAGAMSDPAVNATALGNRFRAIASLPPTGLPSPRAYMSIHGNASAWATLASAVNKASSRVLYRAYLEDLTVSGRSYAQVQALDYALWQASFGAGGRYAGDTFTAPAI